MFVFLPLVLPLTAWPVARLAEQHLHPRTATRLLTGVAGVMALCSTVCLALVMVVGTAQLPGNPLPDGWSDPEVRAAVPYDEVVGKAAIPALVAVAVACARVLWRHGRVRRQAHRALAGLRGRSSVAVLPDEAPYAYALPGGGRGGTRGGRRGGSGGAPAGGWSSRPVCWTTWSPVSGGRCSRTNGHISRPVTIAIYLWYGCRRPPIRSCAR
ncbi:hypothetical protein GCM10020256_34000 [Streptomyces thermocoprophilus]